MNKQQPKLSVYLKIFKLHVRNYFIYPHTHSAKQITRRLLFPVKGFSISYTNIKYQLIGLIKVSTLVLKLYHFEEMKDITLAV